MELLTTVENAVRHQRETGNFVVIYRNSVIPFCNLIPAMIFYLKLNAEASLWDITESEELLEKKVYKEL